MGVICVFMPLAAPRQKRIRDASNRRRGGWKYQKAQANRQMAMERQEQGERIDHALEIMGSLARSLESIL